MFKCHVLFSITCSGRVIEVSTFPHFLTSFQSDLSSLHTISLFFQVSTQVLFVKISMKTEIVISAFFVAPLGSFRFCCQLVVLAFGPIAHILQFWLSVLVFLQRSNLIFSVNILLRINKTNKLHSSSSESFVTFLKGVFASNPFLILCWFYIGNCKR